MFFDNLNSKLAKLHTKNHDPKTVTRHCSVKNLFRKFSESLIDNICDRKVLSEAAIEGVP